MRSPWSSGANGAAARRGAAPPPDDRQGDLDMPAILVVDDLAADRGLVAEYLKDDPELELSYAIDGAEALEKMEQELPDLVVTDLMMPKVDGLELVRACRRRYPLVPVILMTSNGSQEIVLQPLQQE